MTRASDGPNRKTGDTPPRNSARAYSIAPGYPYSLMSLSSFTSCVNRSCPVSRRQPSLESWRNAESDDDRARSVGASRASQENASAIATETATAARTRSRRRVRIASRFVMHGTRRCVPKRGRRRPVSEYIVGTNFHFFHEIISLGYVDLASAGSPSGRITHEDCWRELRRFLRVVARGRHRRGCAPHARGVTRTLRGVRLAPVWRRCVKPSRVNTILESTPERGCPTRGVHGARAADQQEQREK